MIPLSNKGHRPCILCDSSGECYGHLFLHCYLLRILLLQFPWVILSDNFNWSYIKDYWVSYWKMKGKKKSMRGYLQKCILLYTSIVINLLYLWCNQKKHHPSFKINLRSCVLVIIYKFSEKNLLSDKNI